MTSAVDFTKPVHGNPTTQSVRDNFATVYDEITELQSATSGAPFLPIDGGTMNGPITLPNDPASPLQAVTKRYVDNLAFAGGGGGGGGISDAPADGMSYARGYTTGGMGWTKAPKFDVVTLSHDPIGNLDAASKQYVDARAFPAAPNDSAYYGRHGTGWSIVAPLVSVGTDVHLDLNSIGGMSGSFTGFQGIYQFTNQTSGVNFPPGTGNTGAILHTITSNPGWQSQLYFATSFGMFYRGMTPQGVWENWARLITDSYATFAVNASFANGISFPNLGSSNTDLSKSIQLFSGYGINAYNSRLNIISGSAVVAVINGVDVLTANAGGIIVAGNTVLNGFIDMQTNLIRLAAGDNSLRARIGGSYVTLGGSDTFSGGANLIINGGGRASYAIESYWGNTRIITLDSSGTLWAGGSIGAQNNVYANGDPNFFFGSGGAGKVFAYSTGFWFWEWNSTTGDLAWVRPDGGFWVMRLSDSVTYNAKGAVGGIGAYINYSDERAKDNIASYQGGLDKILELNPISFNRKQSDRNEVGFSAQQVKQIIPEAVVKMGIKLDDGSGGLDDPNPTLAIADVAITATMVNAIKTLHDRIAVLEGRQS